MAANRGHQRSLSFRPRTRSLEKVKSNQSIIDASLNTLSGRDLLILEDSETHQIQHIDLNYFSQMIHLFKPSIDRSQSFQKYNLLTDSLQLLSANILSQIGLALNKNATKIFQEGKFWLDVCHPTATELCILQKVFKMHPLTCDDLGAENEEIREKCDVFETYFFICVRALKNTRNTFEVHQDNLFIFINPWCILTIHSEPLELTSIKNRIELLSKGRGFRIDWVVYSLLEEIMEMSVPLIKKMESEIDIIEDQTLIEQDRRGEGKCSSIFANIAKTRKQVTQLIRFVSAKSEILRLVSKRCACFSGDPLLYLKDLQEHTIKVDQILKQYDESLNRSHSHYLAFLSIRSSENSNRMSGVMKRLTVVATILLPWTVIPSLMSVNMFLPGSYSYYERSLVPWLSMIIFMMITSLALFVMGKCREWF